MTWSCSSLRGWSPDPRHPGFLRHPDFPRSLRYRDGSWYVTADVAEGKVEMTDAGPRLAPGWLVTSTGWVREQLENDPIERFQEALAEHAKGQR
jgi:hypothetical protein